MKELKRIVWVETLDADIKEGDSVYVSIAPASQGMITKSPTNSVKASEYEVIGTAEVKDSKQVVRIKINRGTVEHFTPNGDQSTALNGRVRG